MSFPDQDADPFRPFQGAAGSGPGPPAGQPPHNDTRWPGGTGAGRTPGEPHPGRRGGLVTRSFDPAWNPPDPALVAAAGEGLREEAGAGLLPARVQVDLGRLLGTAAPVLLFPGEAALLREIATRSGVAHRALALVTGAGGEALARAAEALGKEVIRLAVPPGHAVEPEHLAHFIQSPPVDAVLAVQVEPETGALLPLDALGAVVRSCTGVLLLVDASDSLAREPLEADRWGLDFVVAPVGGALGIPPGLAVASASPRLLARARERPARGLALDPVLLFEAARSARLPAPLADGLLAALDAALACLATETLPARYERIRRLRGTVDTWVANAHGWQVLARPGRRAAGLSVLTVPPGLDATLIRRRLAADGWAVGAGLGAHARATIRVAHAGETTAGELAALLEALERLTGGSLR